MRESHKYISWGRPWNVGTKVNAQKHSFEYHGLLLLAFVSMVSHVGTCNLCIVHDIDTRIGQENATYNKQDRIDHNIRSVNLMWYFDHNQRL